VNNDYEPVLAGLLSFLTTKVGSSFPTIGRRVKMWTDVETQPALFLRHIRDDDMLRQQFAITELDVEIWVYAKAAADPSAAPDTAFNGLIKAIRNALAPDGPQLKFTIGGLVDWCRIVGKSEIDDGSVDGQCKAVIPLRISLP